MRDSSYKKPTDVIVTAPISQELYRKLKIHSAKTGLSIKALLTQAIEGMVDA